MRAEILLALHQPDRGHGNYGVEDGEQRTVPAVLPEVHSGAVLEQHGESPDEGFGRMQEPELGSRCRHECQKYESGRDTGLMIEAQRVDDAGGDGAEDDKAGQDRGEHEGEHEAARQEAEGQTHEAASGEGEAAHGQTAGQPTLVHGFANDHGGKGYPRKDRGPRAEDDFSRGHVAKHIGKAQKLEHKDGHAELARILVEKEVIFAEDVEKIFGKRPWTSRTEELLSLNEESNIGTETLTENSQTITTENEREETNNSSENKEPNNTEN